MIEDPIIEYRPDGVEHGASRANNLPRRARLPGLTEVGGDAEVVPPSSPWPGSPCAVDAYTHGERSSTVIVFQPLRFDAAMSLPRHYPDFTSLSDDTFAITAKADRFIPGRTVSQSNPPRSSCNSHHGCNGSRYSAAPFSNSRCRSVEVFPLLLGGVVLERPGAVLARRSGPLTARTVPREFS